MSRTYAEISGDSIHNLQTVLSSGISGDDLFLVSQQVLTCVSPDRTYESNGRVYHTEYRSAKESYSDLRGQFTSTLSSAGGLKSMAWELSDGYARAGHSHDYSTLRVKSTLGRSSDVSAVGMFRIDTRDYEFYVSRPAVRRQPKPYIGQLKFLAVRNPPAAPNLESFYRSSDFDGWVYPDGREIPISAFPAAYACFGDSYGAASAGKFKLPNLTEFVRPYAAKQPVSTILTATVAEVKAMPAHGHDIGNLALSGIIESVLSIMHVNDNHWVSQENAAQHGGRSSGKLYTYEFATAFNCSGLFVDTGYIGQVGDDQATYPSHTTLPTMMYIGGV